jgi:hypothetical protein
MPLAEPVNPRNHPALHQPRSQPVTTVVRPPKPREEAYRAARAAAEHLATDIPAGFVNTVVDAALLALRRHRPPIVALLAAGQHGAALDRAERLLTEQGSVVLPPVHADPAAPPDVRTRQALDTAQRRKLMLADVVVVLVPDQRMGTWLQDLVRYARALGKSVTVVATAETALEAAGYPARHTAGVHR